MKELWRLLAAVALLLRLLPATMIPGKQFVLVDGKRVPVKCALKTISFDEVTHLKCAGSCITTPLCTYFCFDEDVGKCVLFEGHIFKRYNEEPPGGITYTACYTSWYNPRNVILPNMTTTATKELDDGYSMSPAAIDGYQCAGVRPYYYKSMNLDTVDWTVDLGKEVEVAEVRIIPYQTSDLKEITLRLGNYEDFTNNPEFTPIFNEPFSKYQELIFTPQQPIKGRYLTIVRSEYGKIVLGEVQVIST